MKTEKKVTRSIRLTPDVDARLLELCEHLGISVHNYLVNEIGKSIARDEMSFKAKQMQSDAVNQMQALLVAALKEQ